MKRKNLLLMLMLVFVLSTVLAGCKVKNEPSSTSENNEQTTSDTNEGDNKEVDGNYTIGVSLPAADHGWVAAIIENAKKAAEEYKNIEFLISTAKDPASQTSDINDLITQKVDAVVMLPIESEALTPAALQIAEAGIPLINIDRKVSTERYRTYIGGDNYGAGLQAAKALVKELKKQNGGEAKGNVIEVTGVPSSVTELRSQGFRDYISQYPGIKIVATQPGNFTKKEALEVTENMLTAHKDVDAVYSQDDAMTMGIVRAIKDAGREDEMFIVSVGAAKQVLKMIKEGTKPKVVVDVTYPPTMSGSAVHLAARIVQGKGLPTLEETAVPHDIVLRAVPITKENVAEFYDPDSDY